MLLPLYQVAKLHQSSLNFSKDGGNDEILRWDVLYTNFDLKRFQSLVHDRSKKVIIDFCIWWKSLRMQRRLTNCLIDWLSDRSISWWYHSHSISQHLISISKSILPRHFFQVYRYQRAAAKMLAVYIPDKLQLLWWIDGAARRRLFLTHGESAAAVATRSDTGGFAMKYFILQVIW